MCHKLKSALADQLVVQEYVGSETGRGCCEMVGNHFTAVGLFLRVSYVLHSMCEIVPSLTWRSAFSCSSLFLKSQFRTQRIIKERLESFTGRQLKNFFM